MKFGNNKTSLYHTVRNVFRNLEPRRRGLRVCQTNDIVVLDKHRRTTTWTDRRINGQTDRQEHTLPALDALKTQDRINGRLSVQLLS